MNDILERMRAGELILETDPDYPALYRLFEETMSLVGELNTGYHTADGVRALLERIWGEPLDASVRMFPPFHTAFGKFTRVGKGVFINFGCTFLDRGNAPQRLHASHPAAEGGVDRCRGADPSGRDRRRARHRGGRVGRNARRARRDDRCGQSGAGDPSHRPDTLTPLPPRWTVPFPRRAVSSPHWLCRSRSGCAVPVPGCAGLPPHPLVGDKKAERPQSPRLKIEGSFFC